MTALNFQNKHGLLGSPLLLISLLGLLFSSCATQQGSVSRDLSSVELTSPTLGSSHSQYQKDKSYLGPISFDWPVDDARLTRGFLPNKRRPHLGIDLAAPKGTPILASHSGTVIYTGRDFRGYGKMVMIENNNGWATLYAHFNKILVQQGQKVTQGDILGEMGQTGRATGVHLHFELRKNLGPVDPLPYLPNGEEVAKLLTAKL